MKKSSKWLAGGLALLTLGMMHEALAQTLAWDSTASAAYTNGWQAGDAGGTNFGAWAFAYSGTGGTSNAMTIGSSTDLDPAVDINTNGTSFRLTGLDAYAHAWRDFFHPLETNETFRMKFAAGVAANNKGLDLRAFGTTGQASYPSLLNLASRAGTSGGTWYVKTQAGQQFFSDGPHPNTWFEIEVTQARVITGLEQGIYKVIRHGQFNETIEGTYYGRIGNVKVYGSTDGDTDADAIYFNDFSIEPYSGPPIVLPPVPPTEDYANDAAYADGWTSGDSGGRGFQPWQIDYAGSGTSTIDDSTTLAAGNSGADINTNGVSFKLYHDSTGYIQCLRKFTEPLVVGGKFTVSVAVNQSAQSMNKGLNINDISAGVNSPFLLHFRLAGGTYFLSEPGNPTTIPFADPPSANTRFDLTLTQVDPTNFTYEVVRSGDYSETVSGILEGRVGGFKFYGKMGDADPEDAIFFNNLRLIDPPPAGDPNLRITGFQLMGSEIELRFASEFGKNYNIQGSSDLANSGWVTLTNVPGNPPENTNTVSAAFPVQCYRIEKTN